MWKTWIYGHLNTLSSFSLQRIRKDTGNSKFYMSIDYTARTNGETVCEKGVGSQLTEVNPFIQPNLVGLDFVSLEFMRKLS